MEILGQKLDTHFKFETSKIIVKLYNGVDEIIMKRKIRKELINIFKQYLDYD